MENELLNIQMTSEEYTAYRNCQKALKEFEQQSKQKDEMIAGLRDQYHGEFVQKRALQNDCNAKSAFIEELRTVAKSDMPDTLKLETLLYHLTKENSNERR